MTFPRPALRIFERAMTSSSKNRGTPTKVAEIRWNSSNGSVLVGIFGDRQTTRNPFAAGNKSRFDQQTRTAMTRIWDKEAVVDLFDQYARDRDGVRSLNWCDIRDLLRGIGENPVDATIAKLFEVADQDGNGVIDLEVGMRDVKTDLCDSFLSLTFPFFRLQGIPRACRYIFG